MKVLFSKRFTKQLDKQPRKVQLAFYRRLDIFVEDPFDPLLRVHPLKGQFEGFFSINITGDVRALYEIIGDEIYLYQLIGSHSQLYGK